jgi:hypothetical protein
MLKKAISIALLGIATTIPVVAGGCASSEEQPSAVTGQTGLDPNAYDRSGTYHPEWVGHPWLNPRFQDQKGHYHPEWVGASGH